MGNCVSPGPWAICVAEMKGALSTSLWHSHWEPQATASQFWKQCVCGVVVVVGGGGVEKFWQYPQKYRVHPEAQWWSRGTAISAKWGSTIAQTASHVLMWIPTDKDIKTPPRQCGKRPKSIMEELETVVSNPRTGLNTVVLRSLCRYAFSNHNSTAANSDSSCN